MVLASRTGHALRMVGDAARELGLDVRRDVPGTLWVSGPGLPRLLEVMADRFTAVELREMRLYSGPLPAGRDELVSRLLGAPSLEAVVTRTSAAPAVRALHADRFFSHYQPVVRLADEDVVAYEALLRAEHDGQLVPGGDLFAAAESAGWLHALDRIGRESAIDGAAAWLGDRELFVNFNPTSIYRPEVCLRTTERAARRSGIDMDRLVFEVVESHAVADADHLLGILEYYRSMGARVALDDVGAGYSSLTLLAQVRPEVVKLDKALVQALPDAGATAVVRAVTALAHELGAVVVAEGIETEVTRDLVRDLGADLGQGWLFGRPEAAPRLATPRVKDRSGATGALGRG